MHIDSVQAERVQGLLSGIFQFGAAARFVSYQCSFVNFGYDEWMPVDFVSMVERCLKRKLDKWVKGDFFFFFSNRVVICWTRINNRVVDLLSRIHGFVVGISLGTPRNWQCRVCWRLGGTQSLVFTLSCHWQQSFCVKDVKQPKIALWYTEVQTICRVFVLLSSWITTLGKVLSCVRYIFWLVMWLKENIYSSYWMLQWATLGLGERRLCLWE